MKPIPIILLMVTTCSLFFSCNGESPSRKQDNNTDEAFPRISEASAVTLDGSDSKSSSSMLLFSDEDITDSNSSLEDFVMQKKIPEIEEERKERTATQSPTFQLPKESEEPIRQDTLRDILLSRIESINQILPDQKNFSNSFDDTNPGSCFKACVLGESDYRSGDRITLRVMEGITLNGISIRKHDILEGYCSIQGDRLQIAVHRVKGKPLSLNAYDTDGMKGLWCPENSSAVQSSISSEVISEGAALVSSRVGRLARGITNAGVETLQKQKTKVSVWIPSGYELLLAVEKE